MVKSSRRIRHLVSIAFNLNCDLYGYMSKFWLIGISLVNLGRAHCQIAALQEAYALTFKDTFISSSQRYGAEIKEYESLKKKLESRRYDFQVLLSSLPFIAFPRRLSYDAANSKYEKVKNSKKEKDKREAEDDLELAKQRL